MAKGFSEHEREVIKEKLTEACEKCWGRYGYAKTGIRDLCGMAGISAGAFYSFYPSKEHLFIETAQQAGNRFFSSVDDNLPRKPTKYDFALTLKRMSKELVEWYLTVSEDLDLIARKLPEKVILNVNTIDVTDFSLLVKKYRLRPRVDARLLTGVLQTLVTMTINRKIIGPQFDKTFGFILDSTIENLFE
ncbi:TetR/AcrR family transcriptional regulator [Brucepastera parasyntrophica]|uniref:TetR/AcrR family transcriptional regulator n=1 Tax=Brucepastera parasyntrophica TaxID=2880008 RepID=UPI00210DE099|nr:TetR/AcrR family transcriptional regulator [Brucepastera parasyntrophica]ULQ59770.1 TetR/AcrR family transcriptional regulator [Brucepastera parasyntrophica]